MSLEEKKTENLVNLVTKKKGVTTKKAVSTDKDSEAKAKVKELLKGTSVASLVGAENETTKSDLNIEEIKVEKNGKWMEGQINQLNDQVAELENEIIFYKGEMQRMSEIIQSGGAQGAVVGGVSDNSLLSPNLIAVFKHFERVYMQGYTDAKIVHPDSGDGVLDKLIQYFPQLESVKQYRYRG